MFSILNKSGVKFFCSLSIMNAFKTDAVKIIFSVNILNELCYLLSAAVTDTFSMFQNFVGIYLSFPSAYISTY